MVFARLWLHQQILKFLFSFPLLLQDRLAFLLGLLPMLLVATDNLVEVASSLLDLLEVEVIDLFLAHSKPMPLPN